MSRATVRAAVATWFGGGNVPFLNTVYPHPPKTMKEADAFTGQPAGTGSGGVGWVYLGRQRERRIAFGGPTSGKKMRTYDVGFLILLRSVHPKSEDADADNDTLIDGFTARLQAGRTLGGVVFQAGEGVNQPGADDIKVTVDLPKLGVNGGMTFIRSLVEFSALEELTT